MQKRIINPWVIVVKVLGEALFLFGFLGWMYGVAVQLTQPGILSEGLSHLTPWIRVDTFTILSFLLSIIGFFMWRLTKESARA